MLRLNRVLLLVPYRTLFITSSGYHQHQHESSTMDILFFIAALEASMRNERFMLQDRRDRCEANIREHQAAMRADDERKRRLKAAEESFVERGGRR